MFLNAISKNTNNIQTHIGSSMTKASEFLLKQGASPKLISQVENAYAEAAKNAGKAVYNSTIGIAVQIDQWGNAIAMEVMFQFAKGTGSNNRILVEAF